MKIIIFGTLNSFGDDDCLRISNLELRVPFPPSVVQSHE